MQQKLKHHLWVWLLWLAGFYAVWLYLVIGMGYWPEAKAHWPIAVAMAIGSYVMPLGDTLPTWHLLTLRLRDKPLLLR